MRNMTKEEWRAAQKAITEKNALAKENGRKMMAEFHKGKPVMETWDSFPTIKVIDPVKSNLPIVKEFIPEVVSNKEIQLRKAEGFMDKHTGFLDRMFAKVDSMFDGFNWGSNDPSSIDSAKGQIDDIASMMDTMADAMDDFISKSGM